MKSSTTIALSSLEIDIFVSPHLNADQNKNVSDLQIDPLQQKEPEDTTPPKWITEITSKFNRR